VIRSSTTSEEPRSEELRLALGLALSEPAAAHGAMVALERLPSPYRSTSPIEEVRVRFTDGSTVAVMFKDLSPGSLPPNALQAKPDIVLDPRREIEVYREVLSRDYLGPRCFGSVTDEGLGRYWLFLEKASGVELYQVGGLETWQAVARWLARMHARYTGRIAWLERSVGHLLRYGASFFGLWMPRAVVFTQRPADSAAALRRVAGRYEAVVDRLGRLPSTFVHGEFYASNVLVQGTSGGTRVLPVDWEMAGIGPGLLDLAALSAGRWGEAERLEIAEAYRRELEAVTGRPVPEEEFLGSLDLCRLHVAIQWLGWSPSWSPPPDQEQDWLGEALSLAHKLGI
jgi:hypothetical protein